MDENLKPGPKRLPFWAVATLTGVVGLGGIAWIVGDVWMRAGMMRPAATPPAMVVAARDGEQVRAVVRLRAADGRSAYTVELLDKVDDTTYRKSATVVRVAIAAETSFVMGALADLKPGAIVQVSGTMDSGGVVQAKKIVILTGYVHVAPEG
jgi:uncharacterized protein DUF5666